MLTRRYGSHSFESNRETLAQKMDSFLVGKSGYEPQTTKDGTPDAAEQALKVLAQTNPELLRKIVKSIQLANR